MNKLSEHNTKILDNYMADENFFSRLVVCHPNSEAYFKARIKADDITLLTSSFMDKDAFIVAKDC